MLQSKSTDLRHPAVASKEGLEYVVSFCPVKALDELPTPWPRCQELQEILGPRKKVPTKDDLVLAVSHAWSHQLHPDPLGIKAVSVRKLVDEAVKDYQISGDALLFFDFMSMSQNPFLPGQKERTPSEQQDFLKGIEALPEIFFTSDAVLHIDGEWPDLDCELEEEMLPPAELEKYHLKELGNLVLVYEEKEAEDGTKALMPIYKIDSVRDVSHRTVTSIDDIKSPKQSMWSPKFCCSSQAEEEAFFVVRPAPLGKRNQIPASDRGWIYFERLVSTIRVALTDEQYAARTVYANIPELKESILQRAHILRKAAVTSNPQLKDQFQTYIEEIQTKTFQATSLDKKKASAVAKVSDTDLVFSLLDHLRCRISLALALTVRNLTVEECRELLDDKADLTIQDGRGYTVLHNATRWRNPQVVEFLLENGSSQGIRDKLGNTAGHVIPLYADDTTVELCRILGDDEKYLAKMNRAGLPVLKRIETWALTAVDGKPFQKALDWVKEKQEQFPRLTQGGKKACVKLCTDRFEVECSSIMLTVNSKQREVHVVAPKFPAAAHVLYLGFPRFVPFSLQLPALKQWAGTGLKVWVISEDAVDPERMTSASSPDSFVEDLAEVIRQLLPSLPEKFILVDSSWGPGAAMAWQFKSHLLGAMIINVHLFKPPDFDETEAAKKIKNRMQQLGGMFERRDIENIQSFVTDIMFPNSGAEGIAETKRSFQQALEGASENFWRLSALQPSWNFENLTKIFTGLEEWPLGSPPVVLACSDQAPLVVVSESMQRLNQIMAGSKLEFISSSKWSWPLEGQEVLDQIACFVQTLVPLPELRCEVTNVLACEDQRPIHVIAPESGPATANILYLGLPRFIPFELQLPALKTWVKRLRVKIWAIMEDSISSACLETGDPKDLLHELTSLTNALLPELGGNFLLVDSTFGSGVPLAWQYRSMLSGVMILNCHLFMAPDFASTESGGKIQKRMATLGEMFAKRDEEKILATLPDFMYPSGGAEGVEATKKRYKEATSRASENFWKISALQPSWNFQHITQIISSLEEWPRDDLKPVVLACSDQAPGVVVTESMQRLNHLMAGSELKFISSSKWSWPLEGEEVIADVTVFLDALLPQRISEEETTRKSLPLLGQQVILPPIVEGASCNPCRNACGEAPILCPVQ